MQGLGPSNTKAVICLVAPKLHCWSVAKQESPLGVKIFHGWKSRCKSCEQQKVSQGHIQERDGDCEWGEGYRSPGALSMHTHELGIHRNTFLTEGHLITSAADAGFNICVLIYLTSAEHPKKIFKYGMGNPAAFWVHQISHTPFSNVFSFAKLKMHFAKHVLC